MVSALDIRRLATRFSIRMESKVGLLFLLSLVYCLAAIEGDTRCYCNESGCISTGYMCKSQTGRCYTMVTYEGEVARKTQGCVDSLLSQQKNCGEAQAEVRNNNARDIPFIRCCSEDMCNYKIPDTSIINTPGNSNKTKETSMTPVVLNPQKKRNPESDLWFKAAVIAVPIAGGFILILLVLLAVRMLRTDSRRHRQLIQFRRERTSLTKAQLYVTDHFSEKTEKSSSSSLFGEKHNSVCKDVNIKVDKDGKIYEQVCEKSKSKRVPPSIIIWGKPMKKDFATVV